MEKIIQVLKQRAGIEHNPDQEGLDLFAELIVLECQRICNSFNEDSDTTHAEGIGQYFGVK